MSTKLSVTATDLDDEDLQALTRSLCQTINQETDVIADLPEEAGGAGHKGDIGLIGQIILTALGGGGAVVALIGVLKAYFERSASIEMEFEREDGRKLKIRAENMNPERIDQTFDRAKEFFGS